MRRRSDGILACLLRPGSVTAHAAPSPGAGFFFQPMAFLSVAFCLTLVGAEYDELKVKRQETFGFTKKPAIKPNGKGFSISFASKGYCDVTVAVENDRGRIVRHLACGVLGDKAPAPFTKGALQQTIFWDGKDDEGKYIDDLDNHSIRVSLGLKPRFEKNLFWSPKKRISAYPPLIRATKEGVYVCEGRGVDFVRLYSHEGEYLRTIYPFPADRLGEVKGLKEHVFPQDGKKLPVKRGFVQATLLTSGTSCLMGLPYKFGDGFGASAMDVRGDRIALAHLKLNRLSTKGHTGGLDLSGTDTTVKFGKGKKAWGVKPTSAAFSPDGKTLYLSGYFYKTPRSYMYQHYCLPVVMKVSYEGTEKDVAQVFLGKPSLKAAGTGNDQFKAATSVAVDKKGRVYVSDYPNDRIQIFGADGAFLKSIKTRRPALVRVDPRNGEIWAFSWMAPTDLVVNENVQPQVTRYGSFDDPKKIASGKLPFKPEKLSGYYRGWGLRYSAEIDTFADKPTVWIVGQREQITRKTVVDWGAGVLNGQAKDKWTGSGLMLLKQEKGGAWKLAQNFVHEAGKAVKWTKPAAFSRQRLYVNPVDGKLFIANELGFGKSFTELVRIDPESGKTKIVALPFDTEDLAFDMQGRAYLRTDKLVARFDSRSWREIPWDYGEERNKVGFSSSGGSKRCSLISALPTPGQRPVFWHQGGMWVNAKGNIAVCCVSRAEPRKRNQGMRYRAAVEEAKPYTPAMYPGRARWQEIHVWNKHGELIYEDAVPGMGVNDGLGIDKDDNLYFMAANTRMFGAKRYHNVMSGTVMKFGPKKGRVLSKGGGVVKLPPSDFPKRPVDIIGSPTGPAWVEGADWLYGGVGYSGMIMTTIGYGCCCWNARYNIDYFARSFAPEIDHYSVAVLDSNGNLILRVGRYGNVDDGVPSDRNSRSPKKYKPNSIGGDEVALFHGAYVTCHTDRRLFIADPGNGRVLSVKLDYHKTETVKLKGQSVARE